MNTKTLLGEEGATNLLNQIMDLWIKPAITQKIKDEKLKHFIVPPIIAITFPYGKNKRPKVLFGNECGSTKLLARFVGKKTLQKGDAVFQDDIENPLEIMDLPSNVNPNDGYIILLGHKKHWNIIFNFQRKFAIVKSKLELAIESLNTAESAMKECNIHSFIVNLHATAELTAEIMMLIVEGGHIELPKKHPEKFRMFQERVSKEKIIGGDFIHAFNRLQRIKNPARYGEKDHNLNLKQLKEDFHIVKITLEKIEPKAMMYSKFNGKLTN